MKKWENSLIQKNYNNKIKNAKPILKTSTKSVPKIAENKVSIIKSTKNQNNQNIKRQLESAGSNKTSISDYYEFEKSDLTKIPLYKLLKLHHLQQYAKELISRGFGYDLQKFLLLPKKDIEILLNDIKVLPGHKTKIFKLIEYITQMFINIEENLNFKNSYDNCSFKSKSAMSESKNEKKIMSLKDVHQNNNNKNNQILKKKNSYQIEAISDNYFLDNENNKKENVLLSIKNTKKEIIPNLFKKKTIIKSSTPSHLKINNILSQTNKYKLNLNSPNKKSIDAELYSAPKIRLLYNLNKNIINEAQSNSDLDLQYSQIKNMYISFDSGKMTSTLINLDIEEMTYCLSCVIVKYIEYGEQINDLENFPFDFRNISMNTDLTKEEKAYLDYYFKEFTKNEDEKNFELQSKILDSNQKNKYNNKNYDNNEDSIEEIDFKNNRSDEDEVEMEFEQSKKEIESILKESILHINDSLISNDYMIRLKNTATFKDEENKENLLKKGLNYKNCTLDDLDYKNENDSIEESNNQTNQTSFCCSKITHFDENNHNELSFSQDLKIVYEKAFNEKVIEKWITCKPTKEVISNFCKNIIITSKMEKEVTIICLIYLERLILKSKFIITNLNWRRIVFISLILASKLWDDESFENDNFAQVFPQYSTKEINSIEMVYLQFINFELYITSAEYAKYYFILRNYAEKNKKSFPLKQLDINQIIFLQNNSNNSTKVAKEIYMNAINKSF